MNCLRLLTRLIPFAFETNSKLNDDFFWKVPEVNSEKKGEPEQNDDSKMDITLPVGHRIINVAMELCYVSNFTVAPERVARSKKAVAESMKADPSFSPQLVLTMI